MLTLVDGVSRDPLPSAIDFDPWKCDLDARHAWKTFGGLSLEDAYTKFCQIPESYQEDFMFMGPAAFLYYFPVIDEYLRSAVPLDHLDDCQADILGSCVAVQLDWNGARMPPELRVRIESLCEFVLSNLSRLASSEADREEIKKSWAQVHTILRMTLPETT